MANQVVYETNLPNLKLLKRGKVRDIYDLGEHLLIVASDRISAFDVVLPTPIPEKGVILTQMAAFWFEMMSDIAPNHLVTTDIGSMSPPVRRYRDVLTGRSMLVVKAQQLLVECVVRGYLAGSGLNEYRQKGSVCGIPLPKGLQSGQKLQKPLFTPASKALEGHDENITLEKMHELVGRDLSVQMQDISLAVYERARNYADERGVIIADTKLEFGIHNGRLLIIDELLTPDSSRFWPKDNYTPGGLQLSFDKQFLRDYLHASGWDKNPPAPELPPKVIDKTAEKYVDAFRRLTGRELPGK